jgi:hypothetical protein
MPMTPHERMVIALRHGVIVQRKATMRYAADVVHQSARSTDDDRFCVVPIEAASEMEAARKAAEIAAARRYEEQGSVGRLSLQSRPGWFWASIGVQERSADGIALRGVTVSIHVWTVE